MIDFIEATRNSEEAGLMTTFLEYRFRRGYSSLILVIGERGTGKSSTCYRLSELYNERINPRREKMGLEKKEFGVLVDSHLKLIEFVKDSQMGDDCILEEVSVLYPSRRAMSEESVGVSKILDIIRKKRLIILANCPVGLSADKNIRNNANALIQTYKIIKSEKVVWSKFWKLQLNYLSGKTYMHKFSKNGNAVDLMYTRMPNMKRWEEYEQKKDNFMEEHYEKLMRKAELKNNKELKELGYIKLQHPELTPKQNRVYDLRLMGRTQIQIAKELGISQPAVVKHLKLMKVKGYKA